MHINNFCFSLYFIALVSISYLFPMSKGKNLTNSIIIEDNTSINVVKDKEKIKIIMELESARELFYQSVDEETYISPAIRKYSELKQIYSDFTGRITVYLGALISLKAKFHKVPSKRLALVKSALKKMKEGLAVDPEDLESLFVYGSICHQLPPIFKKSQEAENIFRKIYALLPEKKANHSDDALSNIVEYMLKYYKWNTDQLNSLESLKKSLRS